MKNTAMTMKRTIFVLIAIFSEAAVGKIRCEDSSSIRYRWEWCGLNKITHTNNQVTKVCYGTVAYTDMVYEAIQLNFKSKSDQECLFATGSRLDLNEPDCKGGVSVYSTIYGEPAASTVVKECRKNGQTMKIEGVSAVGLEPFLVIR